MARATIRLSIVLVAVVAAAGLASCHGGPPNTYVALGDSYVAGPLIPDQIKPYGCLKSNHNYPHLAFQGLGLTRLADVSCSGAQTEDMFTAQDIEGGQNPPQLNAVTDHTRVLTVGIGGNDIGFTDIAKNCGNPADQTPCRDDYVQNGQDELRNRIDETGPLVNNVLDAIERRAPQADVFVVGYPTILPHTGTGCYPREPIKPEDVVYLRGIVQYLNAMLANQAQANGAAYIDLYTPSIGHDICQLPGVKWVEGVAVTSPAAPVHPNGLGMQNFANIVRPRLQAVL